MSSLHFFRRRICLLPVVLAALALRALIPNAGMAAVDAKMGYDSTLCSSVERGAPEKLQAPGEDHSRTHCEYCVAPLLGAPLAHSPLDGSAPRAERVITQFVTQITDAPLARTQRARAPPHG